MAFARLAALMLGASARMALTRSLDAASGLDLCA